MNPVDKQPATPNQIVNALTIDVEDYFQVNAFSKVIPQEDWDSFEPTVERNTYRILDILDSHNEQQTTNNGRGAKQRGTFFILGWVAERYPELVRDIHARGHEVACHGYAHQVIFNQTKEEFREDVKKAKRVLEGLIGKKVIGYRAPTYSITKETVWALEVLHELGFLYDSSIFPIKHDVYGFPRAPRFPFSVTFDSKRNPEFKELDHVSNTCRSSPVTREPSASIQNHMTEFPLTTLRVLGQNFPVAGGGYFRLLPYPITKTFLRRVNEIERKAFVFYIHPWEIDPGIPKINDTGIISRFRTYRNLDKTEDRFKRLLSNFSFSPLSSQLNAANIVSKRVRAKNDQH